MYTTEDNPLAVEERRAHILWICDAENEDVFIVDVLKIGLYLLIQNSFILTYITVLLLLRSIKYNYISVQFREYFPTEVNTVDP